MKAAARIIAPLSLAVTAVSPVLFAFKAMGEGPMKTALLLATVAWFAAAPFWLKGGEK
jgi:hypothetical protein